MNNKALDTFEKLLEDDSLRVSHIPTILEELVKLSEKLGYEPPEVQGMAMGLVLAAKMLENSARNKEDWEKLGELLRQEETPKEGKK